MFSGINTNHCGIRSGSDIAMKYAEAKRELIGYADTLQLISQQGDNTFIGEVWELEESYPGCRPEITRWFLDYNPATMEVINFRKVS